jgi:hypothetical protein
MGRMSAFSASQRICFDGHLADLKETVHERRFSRPREQRFDDVAVHVGEPESTALV